MDFLFQNWDLNDHFVMRKICFDILSIELKEKPYSDKFCAIYLEGRNRDINTYEELAAFKSFKLFSQYNYPIFLFVNKNIKTIFNSEIIKKWRINIIPIKEVNTREEYNCFIYKYNVYKYINNIENVLMFHPDGFLIKEGWEDFVIKNDFDYIGSHWLHLAAIDTNDLELKKITNNYKGINIGNGGFSYRKTSKMLEIINKFGNYKFYEYGSDNKNLPTEDLFFSYFGFNSGILKKPTLQQCCDFSRDPIDLNAYINKKSFGFHRPVFQNKYLCTQHN